MVQDVVDQQTAYTTAVVAEIADGRAIVLVGDHHEPWDFPTEMLPDRVECGTFLLIQMQDRRPVSVQLNTDREATRRRGLDHRLARLERVERLTGHEVRVT